MDLVVIEGDGPERRIRVDGDSATIGRAPGCDLVVDRPYVSKEHARVLLGTVLVDLQSSNGTYVDDRRVTSAVVLGERWLTLGRGDVKVRVEVQPETVVGVDSPAAGGDAAKVRALEAEVARLEAQLARQEVQSAGARPKNPEVPAVPVVPAVPAVPAVSPDRVSELEGEIQRLSTENAKLRAGLVELKARAAIQLPKDATEAQQLLFRVQRENGALKRELIKAREELEGRPADRSEALAKVDALLHENVDGVKVPLDAALDEFLLSESFRFLRRVERIVSRLAGGLIQLFRMDTTMVPGAQGNTREIVGQLLKGGDDAETRERLLAYLDEVGRWFVVAVGAQKAAGVRFALDLKESLSEEKLLGDEQLSLLKRKETELWRRAQERLAELTEETVQERLNSLARTKAMELMDSGSDPAGATRF